MIIFIQTNHRENNRMFHQLLTKYKQIIDFNETILTTELIYFNSCGPMSNLKCVNVLCRHVLILIYNKFNTIKYNEYTSK